MDRRSEKRCRDTRMHRKAKQSLLFLDASQGDTGCGNPALRDNFVPLNSAGRDGDRRP